MVPKPPKEKAMLRTLRVTGIAIAIVGLLATTSLSASADPGAPHFQASMVALPASQVNLTLFGIKAGGLPWQIQAGSASISASGRLQVNVEGLVLAAGAHAGTNPIPNGQAIVTCAGVPVAMSSVVSFSPTGNAQLDQQIALPSSCLAPAVFFAGVPAPGVDRWFAVTGW
jgi:hypothetical protein